MLIPTLLRSIEASGLSAWMRESQSPSGLSGGHSSHTLGLVLIAGPSVVMDLRILGVAPQAPASADGPLPQIDVGRVFINLSAV